LPCGTGEASDKVGVRVAAGGSGVVPASDCVQAVRARSIKKTGRVFEFMFFSFARYHSRIFWFSMQVYKSKLRIKKITFSLDTLKTPVINFDGLQKW
jgi:hypothetical protein